MAAPGERPALLDPVALMRLENLELRARSVVEGALAGLHRSPHHGASVEFAEHKEYAPGDEVKHIDWKAYGKFDRYYVKRFEEETELRAWLVVDTSASMGYRGRGVSKLEFARQLGAALGWMLLRQRDTVGLVAHGTAPSGFLPTRGRGGHLQDLLVSLEALAPSGGTDLPRALTYASEMAQRRALIVLLSDLLPGSADPDAAARHRRDVEAALRGLRARRHDVVVYHLLDDDELDFPFHGTTQFEGMEEERRLLVEPDELRRAYLEEMERFCAGWRRALEDGDVEYHLVRTSSAPATALAALLEGPLRAGAKRVGRR